MTLEVGTACAGTWPLRDAYAVLGHRLPHIHEHLIPRPAGDPAAGETVWSRPHPTRVLSPEARGALIARIQAQLP